MSRATSPQTVTDPAEWYVERSGNPPAGPLTLEQVHEGFLNGEYAAKDRVTSTVTQGRFLTVKEASEAFQRRTATGSIHLPPRPSTEITGFIERDNVPRPPDAADPTASLYELVQTIKEKKPAPKPVAEIRGAPEPEGFRVPGPVWLVTSITLILGVAVWVLAALLNHVRQPATPVAGQTPATPQTAAPNVNPTALTPRPASTVTPTLRTQATQPAPVVRTPARPTLTPNAFTTRTPPPPAPSDRDRERERAEREREEKEREEKERDDRDWWRARDERNQPIVRDRFGEEENPEPNGAARRMVPGTEPGTPNLRGGAPGPDGGNNGHEDRDAPREADYR